MLCPLQEGRSQWSMLCDARTAATGPGSPSTPVKLGCNRTSISLSWQVRARRGARQTPPLPSAHPVLLRRPGSRQHAACAPSMQTPEDDGGSAISEYEAELLPKCAGSRLGGMPNEWLLVYRVRQTRHPAPASRESPASPSQGSRRSGHALQTGT